jgi:hypothetical protein
VTEYVKSTNFASKDSLSIGNPLKIVKGTEIDTEFNNIATAVATKADIANPTFTGVPSAPTAAVNTNTTQLANTAFVQSTLQAALAASVYPVGSLYLNATNATNPATLLGFGTWVSFGAGRMPVGFNAADPLFDAAEETGGSKDATLVSHNHTGATGNQSSDHAHSFSGSTAGAGAHSHSIPTGAGGGTDKYTSQAYTDYLVSSRYTDGVGDHAHSFSGSTGGASSNHTHGFTTSTNGSSATNANLPPYITVYMWKRTA